MMNLKDQDRHCWHVILSAAKNLRGERFVGQNLRFFAALRMT